MPQKDMSDLELHDVFKVTVLCDHFLSHVHLLTGSHHSTLSLMPTVALFLFPSFYWFAVLSFI